MTNNEIIKALECCTTHNGCISGTNNCPIEHYHYGADCPLKLVLNALDLINRQKAEIERLEGYNANLSFANQDVLNTLETEIKNAKTEAIKEFAEKFKSTLENLEANSPNKTYQTAMQDMLDYYVPKIIDNLVKEMTEATDEIPH